MMALHLHRPRGATLVWNQKTCIRRKIGEIFHGHELAIQWSKNLILEMLKGHINGTMLGKTFASRPSPCPLKGRVRAKAAPQVAPHFGTTIVHDLVFNGMHICNDILMLERGGGKI